MTPAAARAMYARQIAAHGETLTLARGVTTASVRGRIMMAVPGQATERFTAQITDTVGQRRPTAVLLAETLDAAGFPVPPARGDTLARGSKKFVVTEVDDMTRRIAGEAVAYQLILAG
jgi:hypothetical protein